MSHSRFVRAARRAAALALAGGSLLAPLGDAFAATRTTSIDLDPSEKLLWNVNKEANSVTVFKVTGGEPGLTKVAEIPVGREPTCVATRGREAWVTNAASGTVSVVAKKGGSFTVVKEIEVDPEPRACALSQDQKIFYVASFTAGTITLIDAKTKTEITTATIGGNPGAISVGRNIVFVTDFFARLRAGGPGEGFDDGKEGIVRSFPVGNLTTISETKLSPLADSGFTANRSTQCVVSNPGAIKETFCPDPEAAADSPTITADPQAAFPNQLGAVETCGGRLYLPSVGAQPEPPVAFNTNVQALVHVVDVETKAELPLTVNLNAQIKLEAQPAQPEQSTDRLFANDVVAIESDPTCETFLFVSRGGDYVLRAGLDAQGKIDIGAPDNVVRFQTGHIPTGIVIDRKGKRAYVSNEVGLSVSVLDVPGGTVVAKDVPSATPPEPGSFEHSRLLGKLVFFTALGVPDNELTGQDIRAIDTLAFRGKQSDSGWSTCASCHPSGLADGVTWIFPDGPRQSIPLDGLYSKVNGAHDTRINNWSAARDSVTDFNNNSRNVQCGRGFAGGDAPAVCPEAGATPPNPNVFDHGISQGASEALDMETTWAQTVRPLRAPQAEAATIAAGREVFAEFCASCHGGAKWTKSQVIYLNNPARVNAAVRDPGFDLIANQSTSYSDGVVDGNTLFFLEDAGTFDAANPIEIKQNGTAPLGPDGFNVPSLVSVGVHAPYFHNGSAQTLEDVFDQHEIDGTPISAALGDGDQTVLLAFLRSLDGRTALLRSETDDFKEPLP
jgi:6-phosphogluconolactonase (cycloisomerase 2 family)